MAKRKDLKFTTSQGKLSEDEALRVAYKAGTPIEGGKISDSPPVDLFSGASHISSAQQTDNIIADSKPVELFPTVQKAKESRE